MIIFIFQLVSIYSYFIALKDIALLGYPNGSMDVVTRSHDLSYLAIFQFLNDAFGERL